MKADSKQYTEKAKKEIQLEKQASSKQAEKTEKKAKKGQFKLQALNHALPKNLQECYDRFFESGFKVNP